MDNQEFMEDLAAVLEVEPEELHDNFPFTRDNWNSLSIVSTIVLIDEQFGVAVEGEKLRDCRSLGVLLQLIKEAVASG